MSFRVPLPLIRKGGLALVSQVIFSASSFLLVIVLARRADTGVYAAFITIYTIIQLIASIQNSLLLAPMSVYAITEGRAYITFWNQWSAALNAGLAFVIPLLHFFLFRRFHSPPVALVSTLVGFQYLDQNYLRQQLKSVGNLKVLLKMDALASGVEVLLILAAVMHGPISLQGFTAILLIQWAGARLYYRFQRPFPDRSVPEWVRAVSWIKAHWKYGKWVLFEALPFWVVTAGPVWAISEGSHLDDLPKFNTVLQLIGIVYLCMNAVQSGLVPSLVSFCQMEGRFALRSRLLRYTPHLAGMAVFLALIAWGGLPRIAPWVFGEARGGDLYGPFLWISLALACNVLIMLPMAYYRIVEDTRFNFLTVCVQALVMAAVIIPLTRAFSISGTALSIAVSTLAATILFWVGFAMDRPPQSERSHVR